MIKRCSRIKEFYKISRFKRLILLRDFANLSEQDIDLLNLKDFISDDQLDNIFEKMVENVISAFPMPLGLATNFIINDKDYLIPMAIEEASVIAAVSNAAKLARNFGGFRASADKSTMIGQVHILGLNDFSGVKNKIEEYKQEIIDLANKQDPVLTGIGGGAVDFTLREIESEKLGKLVVGHLFVDVKDAMGANVVNTMCEAIAPMLEKITGGQVLLKIVSNLSFGRIATAQAVWSKNDLGQDLVEKIIQANEVAIVDIFRAVTHNKGIMNGIDAVCMATGNDTRAIEAGAHGYAAMGGQYKPLTDYYKSDSGDLVGVIELPLAVGIVGGATKINPLARLCLKILDVKTSSDLAKIIASVGLAQNFAALKALVSEGIQKGHMRLHSRGKSLN